VTSAAASTVPFTDFKAHVQAVRGELEAAVARVLDSGWFILGPEGEALEKELGQAFGAAHCVAVGNGTDAIQLALEAMGVGAGDEVVTSPLSAAFTVLAILRAGARPVFADVEPRTLTMTAAAAEKALSPRTRVLLPVHLYGHPAEMDGLLDLARKKGLLMLEDACQAHLAQHQGRTLGTLAEAGTLSFYPTKNLGALGDGGAVFLADAGHAARLRQLRNGGQSDRYHHEVVGTNSRLDEMQAALLRVGLRHLPAWNERRRHLAALYTRALAGSALGLPVEEPWARAVWHLYVVRHPRRDALRTALEKRGVGTLIHYPLPLHLQRAFAALGGRPGDFPVTEQACDEILSLPLYPEMSDEQAQRVAEAVREALAEVG
jgi:dTDP-3-amino-3,4,6-trideoxy-alpha-D-glucose transaminase